MPNIFSIKAETLQSTADTIRNFVSDVKLNPEIFREDGTIAENSITIYYREFIDFGDGDYNGILDEETDKPLFDKFVVYELGENHNGRIVPIIYKTDIRDFPDEPDFEDLYFYEGTARIDGVIYAKWRKIEDEYDWNSDTKFYYYTNVVTATVTDYEISPTDFPSKIEAVYDAGYDAGYDEGNENGYTKGTEDGRKSQYDEMWDIIQDNGERTDYSSAFAYANWDDTNFKPKYDIKPTNAPSMFRGSKGLRITDLEAALERAGVVLDTSQSVNLNNAFAGYSLTVVPAIDMRSCTNTSNANINIQPAMITIRKLIVSENTPLAPTGFRFATNLVNLIIEGVIGQNGFDVQYSTKLSKASIVSIINALSATTSGLTVTLSLKAVNKAFETSEGAADGRYSAEWGGRIMNKSNWTISLV